MIISRAGFFRELPHGLPDGESIHDAISSRPAEKEEELLHYLWGNTVLAATASLVDDVLNPAEKAVAPLEIITDGAWVWPRDLAYYVEKYQVSVPLPFVLHIELRNWAQPVLSPEELLQIETAFLNPAP